VDFVAVVDQVIALLRQRGRVAYRTLKRQFQLDDEALEDLKVELLKSQRLAADEDGDVLVWIGDAASPPASAAGVPTLASLPTPQTPPPSAAPAIREAERRQLTVLFCDLVDSTALSSQLDPEDLREVIRAYQDTCAKVIARYEGHIAQYLGDGLLVYFGYPLAHEDDAQRAVRAGLGIVEALGALNTRLTEDHGVHVAVRLGVHTGLVVVGDVGSGTRQEQLALGETPNLAARLQGIAAPNTLAISAATFHLLGGFFACQPLGTPLLKGQAQPFAVYRVLYESMARSRLEAVGSAGLTPLVGREQEVELLLKRWAQVQEGVGQVVLLSGEAGIGKSRLVQVLKEHVAREPHAWLTPCQCSPYHQNTALYPWIDLLERVVLRFDREESPPQKLRKLEGFLVQYGLPLAEVVPLFAALLSLPLAADYAPLHLSPEQQKRQTLQALLTILLRIAAQQPVLLIMEDLHWVDPSTLELLTLIVDQGPTARILALWTFRPDFSPPWTGRSHLTQITLPRLPRRQAVEMTGWVARKALPAEVVEQVIAKTDGVPLFVEELTKMILETGLLQERDERYELTGPLPPLAIPTTLHDSLMARLDRLATVKALAQLGATLGHEFPYALLQAISPWDEGTVQQGLHQLVDAELLYQRGLPPQATYVFKHALIQDAAYQSLLKSTRQQYHQRIAQVLVDRFPETAATQPELVAHHYTEAGLPEQAIPYWKQAGEIARQRSALQEAATHLRQGLALLSVLPESPARAEHELNLLFPLGLTLSMLHGQAAPEVGHVYDRARVLCQQLGDTPRLFLVLMGLRRFYSGCGALQRARAVAEQLDELAQRTQDPEHRLEAHFALGLVSFCLGDLVECRANTGRGLALEVPAAQPTSVAVVHGNRRASCLNYAALAWWGLGYPEQALHLSQEALTLAHHPPVPFNLAFTLHFAACLRQLRREAPEAERLAAATMTLATDHELGHWLGQSTILYGWAVAAQGQREAGLASLRQGLTAMDATGSELLRPYYLALLAALYGESAHPAAGQALVAEAWALVDKNGERWYAAELHRLQGALLLHQGTPAVHQAEQCFQQALDVARRQQAKAWELRAAMSLSRLWQQQGQQAEARALLAPIYGWFSEGFDTADLQEAKALLEELGE
jgi:class 3 adenylate cyclase/predicted ATPase